MKILSNNEYATMKFNLECFERTIEQKSKQVKRLEKEIENLKKDFTSNYRYVITNNGKNQTEIYVNGIKQDRVKQVYFSDDIEDENVAIHMEVN